MHSTLKIYIDNKHFFEKTPRVDSIVVKILLIGMQNGRITEKQKKVDFTSEFTANLCNTLTIKENRPQHLLCWHFIQNAPLQTSLWIGAL